VFIRRPLGMMTGPRGGWPVALLAGVVALLGGGILFLGRSFDRLDPDEVTAAQVVLFAAGTFLTLGGLARYRRREEPPLVRNFLFADAHQVWDVAPTKVTVVELTEDTVIEARHLYSGGVYQQSAVTLTGPDGTRALVLTGEAAVDRLVAFVRAITSLRRAPELEAAAAGGSGGRLGALADRIARYGPDSDWAGLPDAVDPPRPAIDPDARLPGRGRWGSRILRGLAAAGAAAAAAWFLPDVTAARHDYYLFTKIPGYDSGNLTELDAYLAAYPNGRHAAEVRDLRDDRGFAKAERTAKADRSPAALREYLADPANTRHRVAAQRMVAGFYDRILADLTFRRRVDADPVERDLAAAVVVLLTGLKTATDPVVTIGFQGTFEVAPATADGKAREAKVYELRLSQEPRLQELAEAAPDRTAILSPAAAFAPALAARRADLVAARLTAALKRAVKPDLLTLKPAEAGQTPTIEVRSSIRPSGALYLHSRERLPGSVEPAGVLRGYEVGWEVVVRPPGGGPEQVCKIPHQPLTEPRYEAGPVDPEWAPYTAVLHGAFYDLSDRLIRAFGLDPGMAPTAFSYADAATTGHDRWDEPGLGDRD
jgi:hypothetical protein